MPTNALMIDALTVHYQGIQALRGVTLTIEPGEIFALIGSNGAGKSSLVNAVTGLVDASGTVHFQNQDINRLNAHQRARGGIIQVPEGRRVIAPLSVLENLLLGREAAHTRASNLQTDLDRVFALFPILAQRRAQLSGTLSGGQQQMLAIGRALMGHPRVLLLDEPSLGLAPVIVADVFAAIAQLNQEGMTIFLVEQNARLALQTAHRAAVLEQGRIVKHDQASALAHDPEVIEHYFGQSAAQGS